MQNLVDPSFLRTNTMGDAQGLVDGETTFFCNISSRSFFTSSFAGNDNLRTGCRMGDALPVSMV